MGERERERESGGGGMWNLKKFTGSKFHHQGYTFPTSRLHLIDYFSLVSCLIN